MKNVAFLLLACLPAGLGACTANEGNAGTTTVVPSPATGELPCDVDAVLTQSCRHCHGASPAFGAPMPLVTYADLHAAARSDPARKVFEVVAERVHDAARPMPQPPNPRLSPVDTATLDAWIAKGAPAGACDAGAPAADAGPMALSCTPDTHVAPMTPWSMPSDSDEIYVCYGFDANVTTKRHITAFAPRIDNSAIVHHVSLLQSDTLVSPVPAPCPLGGSTSWRAVFGWAPGASSFEMPKEAGFAEDASTHYVVQVHYVNPSHASGLTDASGFELCTTDQLRPNDADVMAFGTQAISIPPHGGLDTTCDIQVPSWGATTHLFAAFPHMHKLGKSIATTATASSGGPAVDLGTQASWSFGEQSWIAIDDLLQPGDLVSTRCVWSNPTDTQVTFGENTSNEMCYSFTMYYPKITDPRWNWALPALYSVCH